MQFDEVCLGQSADMKAFLPAENAYRVIARADRRALHLIFDYPYLMLFRYNWWRMEESLERYHDLSSARAVESHFLC